MGVCVGEAQVVGQRVDEQVAALCVIGVGEEDMVHRLKGRRGRAVARGRVLRCCGDAARCAAPQGP